MRPRLRLPRFCRANLRARSRPVAVLVAIPAAGLAAKRAVAEEREPAADLAAAERLVPAVSAAAADEATVEAKTAAADVDEGVAAAIVRVTATETIRCGRARIKTI